MASGFQPWFANNKELSKSDEGAVGTPSSGQQHYRRDIPLGSNPSLLSARCDLCYQTLSPNPDQTCNLPCGHKFCIQCRPTAPFAQGSLFNQVACPLCERSFVSVPPQSSTSNFSVASNPESGSFASKSQFELPDSSLDLKSNEKISTPLGAGALPYNSSFGSNSFHLNFKTESVQSGHKHQNANNFPKRAELASMCTACTDLQSAICKCEQCNELLCTNCLLAHQRVRVTRNHRTVPLPELNLSIDTSSSSSGHSPLSPLQTIQRTNAKSTPNNNNASASSLCTLHQDAFVLECSTCSSPICANCVSGHRTHSISPKPGVDISAICGKLVNAVRSHYHQMDEANEQVNRMSERVESRVVAVSNEVKSVAHHITSALEERKRDLLQRVDIVRQTKLMALESQKTDLRSKMNMLRTCLEQAEKESHNEIRLKDQLIKCLQMVEANVVPRETDQLVFTAPSPTALTSITSLGTIETTAFAGHTCLVGETYKRVVRDRQTALLIQAKDHLGEVCAQGGTKITVEMQIPQTVAHVELPVQDKHNGTYEVTFVPKVDGEYKLWVFVRGTPINGCPYVVRVRQGRDYTQIGPQPAFSFGTEGNGDGQICRPWGICIDKTGRVLLADRSNNRVQIFDKDGRFILKFGTSGNRAGQFDRPAGITVNSKNQIIVADKDNHRMQVFTEDGAFVFKFGEKGRCVGQFNYPWDVACNSEDCMAVSDTRNHRIQLFSALGAFLRKFGFDNSIFYKHLDSPRGLCFMPDGQLLITDFNNHRLVLMSITGVGTDNMKLIGREGEYLGAFRRPQGVDVDAEGHILVADSRNDRIQVFAPDLTPMYFFGRWPQASVMDRPCDLAVAPDGRVYVVDLGNNRVHVF